LLFCNFSHFSITHLFIVFLSLLALFQHPPTPLNPRHLLAHTDPVQLTGILHHRTTRAHNKATTIAYKTTGNSVLFSGVRPGFSADVKVDNWHEEA
jgi:hypothetical protein